MEVQFASVEEADTFEPSIWFGTGATADKRHKNAQLAMSGMPDPVLLPE